MNKLKQFLSQILIFSLLLNILFPYIFDVSNKYIANAATCSGILPLNSTSNATTSSGIWNYNTTPGDCTFTCNAGYNWDGNSCIVPKFEGLCSTSGQIIYTDVSGTEIARVDNSGNTITGDPSSLNANGNIIVCSGNQTGYVLKSVNEGSNIVGTGSDSYGNYFQWGRNKGFDQTDTSQQIAQLDGSVGLDATTDSGSFVFSGTTWALTDITNNWGNTTNNEISRQGPCPVGYHIPSQTEWSEIYTSWSGGVNGTNFSNSLKLPIAGYRGLNDGTKYGSGVNGLYWSSTNYDTSNAYGLMFSSSSVNPSYYTAFSYGMSLRCIKNTPIPPPKVISFTGGTVINYSNSGSYNINATLTGMTSDNRLFGKISTPDNSLFTTGSVQLSGGNSNYNLDIPLGNTFYNYTGSNLNLQLSVLNSSGTVLSNTGNSIFFEKNIPLNYFKINPRTDSKDKHIYGTGESISINYNGAGSGETLKVYLSGITNPAFFLQVGTGISNGSTGTINLDPLNSLNIGKYLIKMQKVSLGGVESSLVGYFTNPFDYEKDTSIELVGVKETRTVTGTLMYSGSILNAIDNIVTYIDGPSGLKTLYTTGGKFSFTGNLNDKYYIKFDSPLKYSSGGNILTSDYVTEFQNYNIDLNSDKNIVFNTKNNTSTVDFISLTGVINGLNGQDVIFWGNNGKSYYEEKLGILNSNSYSFNIRAPKFLGLTKIGIKKSNQSGSWIEPKPLEFDIQNTSIGGIVISPITDLKKLNIVVKDNNGNTLSGAYIKVYSPSSTNLGIGKETSQTGSATFDIPKGDYLYQAFFRGLDNSIQKTITIGDNTTYNAEIILQKPSIEVSGDIFYNGNTIKDVSMFAYNIDTKNFLNTITNSSGSYKFYLNEGNWKIGGSHKEYGNLQELSLNGLTGSLTNQTLQFIESQTITGSVTLTSGSGVSGVNIAAISGSGNYYTFTDINGEYSLKLGTGSYKIKAFSNTYGFVGEDSVTITSGGNTPKNFTINTPKSISVTFSGAGLSSNSFNWIFDLYDNTDKVGFSKSINGFYGYTFENIPGNHNYAIKIGIVGIGNVYNTGITLNSNKSIEVIIPESEKILYMTGIVYESGTTTPLQDAIVEFRNTLNKQIIGVKTDSNGIYSIKSSSGNIFEIIGKKIGYKNSNILTGVTILGNTSLPTINLEKINSTISLNGTVTNTGLTDGKIFISLKGINSNGNETSKWYGKELMLSGSNFILEGIPENFGSGKIIISADGYNHYTDNLRNYSTSNISLGNITLIGTTLKEPKVMPIIPSLGGVFENNDMQIKVVLPNNALGNGLDSVNLLVKETTLLPKISGSEPLNGKAKEIGATDGSGNLITNLSSDVNIELTYSGSEIYGTKTGVTLREIKNMQISYYDPTTLSWISLPTVVTSSSGGLFDNNSLDALLSSISGYENITFTLKATTDHFTLFTALISSSVSNSTTTTTQTTSNTSTNTGGGGSTSIISGILQTKDKLTTYLGSTTQSIKLLVGNNINDVLTIERNGVKININEILTQAGKTFDNLSSNLVAFGVGDVISTTKNGSLSISIDGYTRLDIASNSKVKISEAGSNFLTYENISGKIKYDFDKKAGTNFTYKVKGKTGYATIRGTIIEVDSDSLKDSYNLIEGKIDVYNSKLKKTISMVAGDKYIAYADGSEDLSGLKSNTNTTTTSTESSTTTKEVEIIVDKSLIGTKDTSGNTIKFMYNDVSEKSWYFKYVNSLNAKGVIANNTKFYPENNITRIELLKMVSSAAGINATYDEKYVFSDVSDKNYWGTKYVCSANKLGYISSSNSYFRPSDNITRAETIKLILNYKKPSKIYFDNKYTFSDISINDWSAKYISTAAKMGIISTTNKNFNPETPITRAEVAKMIYNTFYK